MGKKWDFLLYTQIAALGTISLLVIFSINRNLAQNQLIFWIIGVVILVSVSFFDARHFKRLSLIFYLISLLMLLLLLLIGEPVRGSVRWIDLGAFRLQPSEITKVATILFLANFFSRKPVKNTKTLIASLLFVLPAFFLILGEPDIGNALVLLAIWFGISLFSGFGKKALFGLIIIFALTAFAGFTLLAPYQKQRIETFISPNKDPLGTGYQIIQSKIAVGSGGIFGRGLGRGSQSQLNFLPEAESDFIFASISEQLGFLGASLVVVVFTLILLRFINLVRNTDRFASLIVIGTICQLLFQFVINVGMNMGLVPVTGITFPFVSYGGSSLVSVLFLTGIVANIIRTTLPKARYYQHPPSF